MNVSVSVVQEHVGRHVRLDNERAGIWSVWAYLRLGKPSLGDQPSQFAQD